MDPNEDDNGNYAECFCCGLMRSARTRTKHRADYMAEINAYLAAQNDQDNQHGEGGPADGHDEGDAPGILDGAGIAPDNMDDDLALLSERSFNLNEEDPDDPDDEPVFPAEQNLNLNNAIPPLEPAPIHPAPIHEMRRNPPVTIEDWPEDDDNNGGNRGNDNNEHDNNDDDNDDDDNDDDDEFHFDDDFEANDPDQDPPYIEPPAELDPNALDPNDEPRLMDQDLRERLRRELGDLADEELEGLENEFLTQKDRNILGFLATRLRTHFSRQTWNELRYGVCEPLSIPSEFVAWRRLRILSGLETRAYDCCINSCICYLGKYKDLATCSFCKAHQYNAKGRSRRSYHYTPLIPQLRALYQSPDMVNKLGYRAQSDATREPGVVRDVFDGENYRKLRETRLDPNGDYRIFGNPEDLALGLSTDGFTLFKRRRRGLSTAWPIMLINYNIHPRYRTRLENVICVGVIPGPTQFKDMHSFLIPLIDELLLLERGIQATKVPPADNPGGGPVNFVLRAFLIMLFGDIPAVTKLLGVKGHNGKFPCRTCYMKGTAYVSGAGRKKKTTYYLPLTKPEAAELFPTRSLLKRSHALFLAHYDEWEAARPGVRAKIGMDYGISGRPVFSRLRSFDLATFAPYDIMHLLFENLVPNMILHWTGEFKLLDKGTGNYEIGKGAWKTVGKLTHQALRTIPSEFVGTLPDIAEDQSLYKAEASAFWIQYIAPIVLKGRLPRPYYEHYLLMREIVLLCVQLEIREDQIVRLDDMVVRWVEEYEELYYQYDYERLPACPLTIHALLHLAFYIRKSGPLCNSWSFVMERLCGNLLPAVKNRTTPYVHLDNHVSRRAQMQAVSHMYELPTVARPTVKWRFQNGERVSTYEMILPQFREVILGRPFNYSPVIDLQLINQLTKYFGTVYPLEGPNLEARLRARVVTNSIVRYGRIRLADDGDRIRTASAVDTAANSRDNSFVRYELLPDANYRFPRMPDQPIRATYYAQLLDVYFVEFIVNLRTGDRIPYLLARVQDCKTNHLDAALAENPRVTYRNMSSAEIIPVLAITAVIGRIQVDEREWAIIDRSRDGARTHFRNDDGEDFD